MLLISIFAGIICFILVQSILDAIFGIDVGERNYFKWYYAKMRGEEAREKKGFSLGKTKKLNIQMDVPTYLRYAAPATILIFAVCMLFLRNVWSAAFFSLGGFAYPQIAVKSKIKKRKELLTKQLREAMQSISNSLKAGNSLQTAIERCLEDLKRMMKAKQDKPIIDELEMVVYDLQLGKTLEESLISFRDRVRLEDVDTFVNAVIITKEKGGNLTEVMGNVADAISDKIQIKREIMTLTAGKRSEAKLLTFLPVVLVMALSFMSPSYMKPMYETTAGKILMVFGTILLIINYVIGRKIIEIDI